MLNRTQVTSCFSLRCRSLVCPTSLSAELRGRSNLCDTFVLPLEGLAPRATLQSQLKDHKWLLSPSITAHSAVLHSAGDMSHRSLIVALSSWERVPTFMSGCTRGWLRAAAAQSFPDHDRCRQTIENGSARIEDARSKWMACGESCKQLQLSFVSMASFESKKHP